MDKAKIKAKLIFWYSIFWILFFISLYIGYGVYFIDTSSTKSIWIMLFACSFSIFLSTIKFLEISYFDLKNLNIKNNIIDKFKRSIFSQLIADFFIVILFSSIYFMFQKYINPKFAFCALSGLVVSLCVFKISTYIDIKGSLFSKEYELSSINTSIKLNYNKLLSISHLYWGVFGVGYVILYYLFKDHEMLIGYVAMIVMCAFVQRITFFIINKIFQNTKEVIFKLKNKFKELSNKLDTAQFIQNKNYSIFFELYFLSLVCSMVIGINSAGLMGTFLPLIITSNIVFASILVILFVKINKSNNIYKALLKSACFTAGCASVLTYAEVMFWLGDDFISIAYAAIIGSVAGILVLFLSKENKAINEMQKIKSRALKIVLTLFVLLVVFVSIFKLAQGMDYVLFALYCISISILCFNLVVPYAAILNEDQKYENKITCYINSSIALLTFSSLCAFAQFSQLEEVDILNPIILISFFIGAITTFITIYIISDVISKRTRKLLLFVKKQDPNQVDMGNIYDTEIFKISIFSTLGFASFCVLVYFMISIPGYESLLSFFVGMALSSLTLLYESKEVVSLLSREILKLAIATLLFMVIFFI